MARSPQLIRNLFAILLNLALLWFSPGVMAQVLDDGFSDGGRGNGADPNDSAWYTLGVSGTALSIADDSAGIGSGNALKFTPSAAFQAFAANLPSSVTLADGDTVAFYFDWRFTGATNLNQASRLRFGLHNSGGTSVSSDNSSATANDLGYFAYTNPGLDSATGTGVQRETSGDTILMGSNVTAVGTSGSSINVGTSASTAALIITRIGSSLQVSVNLDGQTQFTGTDPSPVTYTFNEISICTGATSVPSPLVIDNAQVAYYPVLVNDEFTDAGRTNGTDSQDITWYYLGAPFSLGVVDDTAGIGSGNALQVYPSGTFQGMQGNTPWVHLADGDTLTLAFDWRFATANGLNEGSKLRFGLHYSGGTVATGDNIYGIYNNDPGYYSASNPGLVSATGTSILREPAGDGILSGSGNTVLGTPGASISAGTTKHSAKMIVSRSGTSIVISTSIDGQPAATATDTTPTTYVFDEVSAIVAGSIASPKFLIDNVKLTHTAASPIHAEGPPDGTWNLVLDEQFNGTSLNTSVWSAGYRWVGPMNNDIAAMRPENVTVADGVCTIKAEKRTAQDRNMFGYNGVTLNYSSGAITTYNKWTQTYGYFEARLKMPAGKGTWPAFWLLPDRGSNYEDYYRTTVGNTVHYPNGTTAPCPMGNEIDIFEHMGTWINPSTGFSKLHSGYFWSYGGGSSGEYVHSTGVLGTNFLQTPDTQFHTYGLYWAPGQLTYYVDGKVVARRDNQANVGLVPHYVLLNCAVTTNDWTSTAVPLADIDAALPSYMVIDYVRVYSGTPSPTP